MFQGASLHVTNFSRSVKRFLEVFTSSFPFIVSQIFSVSSFLSLSLDFGDLSMHLQISNVLAPLNHVINLISLLQLFRASFELLT